jgi:hypothetical protein
LLLLLLADQQAVSSLHLSTELGVCRVHPANADLHVCPAQVGLVLKRIVADGLQLQLLNLADQAAGNACPLHLLCLLVTHASLQLALHAPPPPPPRKHGRQIDKYSCRQNKLFGGQYMQHNLADFPKKEAHTIHLFYAHT